jgi:fatty acid desaturase
LIIGLAFLVFWLLGLGFSFTLGGFIYVSLVFGLILIGVWIVLVIVSFVIHLVKRNQGLKAENVRRGGPSTGGAK